MIHSNALLFVLNTITMKERKQFFLFQEKGLQEIAKSEQ